MKWDFLTDQNKRKLSSKIWFGLVLIWALVRALLVYFFFTPHGVNPVWYFVIDIASSIPYAIYSAKSVFAYIDKKFNNLIGYGILTTISFYLPDLYIFIFAHEIPLPLLLSFITWIALFTVLAINEILRNIRKSKG